ncbi:hypothetical protein ARMSODRAFT_976056 [Armillaria solidipes]|uniref:Uncharacterized protein n=1 Tax=Armillaria solidipes TaxID=1076256 RepID=A0A2H3BMK5_9AGAR|nr:hypothetical protein ARMSODRAFT_976056 [Armillaria solidipes]
MSHSEENDKNIQIVPKPTASPEVFSADDHSSDMFDAYTYSQSALLMQTSHTSLSDKDTLGNEEAQMLSPFASSDILPLPTPRVQANMHSCTHLQTRTKWPLAVSHGLLLPPLIIMFSGLYPECTFFVTYDGTIDGMNILLLADVTGTFQGSREAFYCLAHPEVAPDRPFHDVATGSDLQLAEDEMPHWSFSLVDERD